MIGFNIFKIFLIAGILVLWVWVESKYWSVKKCLWVAVSILLAAYLFQTWQVAYWQKSDRRPIEAEKPLER